MESEWNYLLFRDGVDGPDVVLQGDGSKRVDGAEEIVESEWNYLLFRESVERSDVVLQGGGGEGVDGGGDSGEVVELLSVQGRCRGV